MRKVIFVLLSLAITVFAGNFQKKNDNTVKPKDYYHAEEAYKPRVDTVYIEKPVEYRYGRVYVRKKTYFTETENNQGVKVYYKSIAPSHCVNPNCKDRHIYNR